MAAGPQGLVGLRNFRLQAIAPIRIVSYEGQTMSHENHTIHIC